MLNNDEYKRDGNGRFLKGYTPLHGFKKGRHNPTKGKSSYIYFLDVCWCGKIVYGNHRYCHGHNNKVHCKPKVLKKTKEGYVNPRKETYKNIYFLDLCWCGCGEIVYGGNRYYKGHTSRTGKHGYNPTPGSFKKGHTFTEETVKKISDGCKSTYLNGRKPWNDGIKMPDEFRYKCRCSHLGQKPSPKVATGKGGYYTSKNNGIIWLRSSYEIAYAKWLDDNDILWLYEHKHYKLSDGSSYFPDFYLVYEDKYVEIKGYMYPKAKHKIEMFIKEYHINLVVLYLENLKNIGCNL